MSKVKCYREKLDITFWWLVWLLPIVGGFLAVFSGGHDFAAFSDFIDPFTFGFIEDILIDVFNVASLSLPSILITLMSYIVSVELCHVLVDVLIFIPRFCHKLVQLDTYVDVEKGGHR